MLDSLHHSSMDLVKRDGRFAYLAFTERDDHTSWSAINFTKFTSRSSFSFFFGHKAPLHLGIFTRFSSFEICWMEAPRDSGSEEWSRRFDIKCSWLSCTSRLLNRALCTSLRTSDSIDGFCLLQSVANLFQSKLKRTVILPTVLLIQSSSIQSIILCFFDALRSFSLGHLTWIGTSGDRSTSDCTAECPSTRASNKTVREKSLCLGCWNGRWVLLRVVLLQSAERC